MNGWIRDWTSLWDLIERRAAATPDARFAVDEDGRSLTFAEYRDAGLRAAAGFAAGVDDSERVGVQMKGERRLQFGHVEKVDPHQGVLADADRPLHLGIGNAVEARGRSNS